MGVMRTAHFKRLARLGAWALVLVVLHDFCVTRSAWAGCNHLVGSRSDPFLDLHRLDELIVSGSISPSKDGLSQSPLGRPGQGRRGPCSGLSCSSRDPLPVSTAAHGLAGSDQWGALGVLVVPDATPPPCRTIDEPALSAAGEKSSIFHPPRV
jgi:hypothetical protein